MSIAAKNLLLRIARIKPLGTLVGLLFQYVSFALPFKAIAETANAICLRHPAPMRPFHFLVIPKRRLQTVFDLIVASHREIVRDLLATAEQAVGTKVGRYRINANYGRRQEVMQVHFHLLEAGPAVTAEAVASVEAGTTILYSWRETNGQLTRLTADLNVAPRTADLPGLVGRDEIADLLIETCRLHAEVLKRASGLTLVAELERAANQVAWLRSVHFTMEGVNSIST